MEGAQVVAELLGHRHLVQQFIGAIAVNLHQHLAAEYVRERLELQIPLRRSRVLVALLHLFVVGVPLAHVTLRINQRLTLHGEIAHSRRRQLAFAAKDALRIFAAGELDRLRRAGERAVRRGQARTSS